MATHDNLPSFQGRGDDQNFNYFIGRRPLFIYMEKFCIFDTM
jgi:hypothetical protein